MELRPFRSIRFSPRVLARAGTLRRLRAAVRPDLAARSRTASTRGRPRTSSASRYPKKDGEDPYAGAAKTLADWLADGTLEKERRPALWIYRQTFAEGGTDLRPRRARGPRPARASTTTGVVRPHERTLAKPKADRLALLAATKADLELVFLLTRAPLSAALSTRRTPDLSATDSDGVRHDAFRISRLRRARRAAGPRQERRGDHRRRPSPLRDRARVLEGPGGGEAPRRPLQALRDRRHGLPGRDRPADPPAPLRPARLETRRRPPRRAGRISMLRELRLAAGGHRRAPDALAPPPGLRRLRAAAAPPRC